MDITSDNIKISGTSLVIKNSIMIINEIGMSGLIKSIEDHIKKYHKTNKIHNLVFNNYQEDYESVRPFIFESDIFYDWYTQKVSSYNFCFIFGSIPEKNYDYTSPFQNDFYFYPWSFLNEVEDEHTYHSGDVDKKNQIDKTFISLNNTTRNHRVQFVDYIHKYNLWDDIHLSLNNINNETCELFKYWPEPRRLQLDTGENELIINSDIGDIFTRLPSVYFNAKIDIIGETSQKERMYTEKTLRPILLKKPFIIIGAPNSHITLKKIFGFKLYDSIFDYQSYDSILDMEERIDYLCRWMSTFEFTDDIELKKISEYNRNRLNYLRKMPKYLFNINEKKITERDFVKRLGLAKEKFPW